MATRFYRVYWNGTGRVLVAALLAAGLPACEEDQSEDLTAYGYDGLTPVHRAANANDLVELERLLYEAGADPNIRDIDGIAPIHRAARDGHLDIVRLLIAYGANPKLETPTDWKPIDLAVREGHLDLVHFLSQYEFNPNRSMPSEERYLELAIRTKNYRMAEYLVEMGADVNKRLHNGRMPLEFAFMTENPKMVHMLLDHGAMVPANSKAIGNPLLHIAIEWDDLRLVRILLARGADPRELDIYGRTPTQHAWRRGNQAMAELLAYNAQLPKTP